MLLVARIDSRSLLFKSKHSVNAVSVGSLYFSSDNISFGSMSGGEFDWGGRLRKGIGGAQRFPQNGRKPFEECKGRRELDCDTDGWSRYESRT